MISPSRRPSVRYDQIRHFEAASLSSLLPGKPAPMMRSGTAARSSYAHILNEYVLLPSLIEADVVKKTREALTLEGASLETEDDEDFVPIGIYAFKWEENGGRNRFRPV